VPKTFWILFELSVAPEPAFCRHHLESSRGGRVVVRGSWNSHVCPRAVLKQPAGSRARNDGREIGDWVSLFESPSGDERDLVMCLTRDHGVRRTNIEAMRYVWKAVQLGGYASMHQTLRVGEVLVPKRVELRH
jgi:hypothetical protein